MSAPLLKHLLIHLLECQTSYFLEPPARNIRSLAGYQQLKTRAEVEGADVTGCDSLGPQGVVVKLGQILDEEGVRALGCAHDWSEPSVCRNRGVNQPYAYYLKGITIFLVLIYYICCPFTLYIIVLAIVSLCNHHGLPTHQILTQSANDTMHIVCQIPRAIRGVTPRYNPLIPFSW